MFVLARTQGEKRGFEVMRLLDEFGWVKGPKFMKTDEEDVVLLVFELVTCKIHNARVALQYIVGPVQLDELSTENYSAAVTRSRNTDHITLWELGASTPH